jgi:hypothetical protein
MNKKTKKALGVLNKYTATGRLIKAWRTNFEVPQDIMAFTCGIS